jgi:hypothetical protein
MDKCEGTEENKEKFRIFGIQAEFWTQDFNSFRPQRSVYFIIMKCILT